MVHPGNSRTVCAGKLSGKGIFPVRWSEIIDPTPVSCYCKKVPQERLRTCVLTMEAYGRPGQAPFGPAGPRGQAQSAGRTCPDCCSFLRRAGTNRIGARAFSTLEGYVGRNWRNGAGFTRRNKRGNARPPSRFSSEIGTKADAKQQLEVFCVRA